MYAVAITRYFLPYTFIDSPLYFKKLISQ